MMDATQPTTAQLVEALKASHAKTIQEAWIATDFRNTGNEFNAEIVVNGELLADVYGDDEADFIALAHNELPMLLDRVEALEAKAALLDRVYACIETHTSDHHGVNIEFTTGEMRYGMWIDDTDWKNFPLMNVLRDIWKAYNTPK